MQEGWRDRRIPVRGNTRIYHHYMQGGYALCGLRGLDSELESHAKHRTSPDDCPVCSKIIKEGRYVPK